MLMSLLTKIRSENPSVKSLVISQFTSMLNILETPLKAEGFNFVRLDGKMSQKQRADVVEWFDDRSPDSPSVMLLSMKAGGVGLNLTAASRVFLLDPVGRRSIQLFRERLSYRSVKAYPTMPVGNGASSSSLVLQRDENHWHMLACFRKRQQK